MGRIFPPARLFSPPERNITGPPSQAWIHSTGKGIYYNATFMEAQLCAGEQVVVIGGGNSAGQAAVFLAQHSAGVEMLVRSESLADTMSRYLIQRIEENPLIHVHYR